MKKLLAGLMILSSFSSFANESSAWLAPSANTNVVRVNGDVAEGLFNKAKKYLEKSNKASQNHWSGVVEEYSGDTISCYKKDQVIGSLYPKRVIEYFCDLKTDLTNIDSN